MDAQRGRIRRSCFHSRRFSNLLSMGGSSLGTWYLVSITDCGRGVEQVHQGGVARLTGVATPASASSLPMPYFSSPSAILCTEFGRILVPSFISAVRLGVS